MKRAIFPGSFDPLTRGHTDIITRALELFDTLTVAILDNDRKNVLFSPEERIDLVRKEFKHVPSAKLEVESFSGLLVDFAKKKKSRIILRGLRAVSDYDYEAQMALVNKNLWDKLETFFLITREEYAYVSSTISKQVAMHGGDVSKFVTPVVARALKKKNLRKK